MGINDTCNSKSNTDNLRIRHEKEAAERYYRENPDSLIPLFDRELRELGFDFEVSENQWMRNYEAYKQYIETLNEKNVIEYDAVEVNRLKTWINSQKAQDKKLKLFLSSNLAPQIYYYTHLLSYHPTF